MTTITLGQGQPTDITIDQSELNDSAIRAESLAEHSTLTITNTENASVNIGLSQYIVLEAGTVAEFNVNIGPNIHVRLSDISQGDSIGPGSSLNYALGDGATLEVDLETAFERPTANYNVDMGADSSSTFIYHHIRREGVGSPQEFSLTGVTANDVIRVPGASRVDYSNGKLNFYGYHDGDFEDSLFVSFDAEGINPDQIHFENGTMTYACYLRGTHIATLDGETKVEHLKAGDQLRTASGGINTVKWIGFRKLNRSKLPAEHALRASPIRICKGALAENIPHRDLTVSPGHRFNFDGALVPALSLVNGLTITQDFEIEEFEYYHVELEKFDMLLAEGAAAESYLEVGSNRNAFENAKTVAAYPNFAPALEQIFLPEYVQKITPEIIKPIRQNLFKRAEILTGAVRTPNTDLRIEFNGQVIGPQTPCKKKGLYRFELPAGLSGNIRILSNASVVRETSLTDRTDTRVIGVGLAGVALISNDQRCEIDLRDDSLTGFNDVQEMDGAMMRWTTGEAVIPADLIPSSKGAATLELNILRTHMYWTSVAQSVVRKVA